MRHPRLAVIPESRNSSKNLFFHFLLGRLQDLDRHLFPPEGALQLADALLRRAQLTGRHDIGVGRDGRLTALRQRVLPPLDLRARHADLAAQLRRGAFATQDAFNLLPLELRRVSAIRPANFLFVRHGAHPPPPRS